MKPFLKMYFLSIYSPNVGLLPCVLVERLNSRDSIGNRFKIQLLSIHKSLFDGYTFSAKKCDAFKMFIKFIISYQIPIEPTVVHPILAML